MRSVLPVVPARVAVVPARVAVGLARVMVVPARVAVGLAPVAVGLAPVVVGLTPVVAVVILRCRRQIRRIRPIRGHRLSGTPPRLRDDAAMDKTVLGRTNASVHL